MINLLIATITVLTWNTGRMGQFEKPEKNEVLHYLLTQDADVVCLQEVDEYKSAIYNKRHQYGTMVWAKYPLINKQSIHYESRGNLSNRCDMVVGADTIRLINNHLESYSFTPADIETDLLTHYSGLLSTIKRIKAKWERAFKLRNTQARVVRKEIETSPYPVIAVGDCNATALSYAYRHISDGMHDAWRETHSWQWGATCEKGGFGIRIDYILCSDPIKPVACSVPDAPGSDHRPVVATLTW